MSAHKIQQRLEIQPGGLPLAALPMIDGDPSNIELFGHLNHGPPLFLAKRGDLFGSRSFHVNKDTLGFRVMQKKENA